MSTASVSIDARGAATRATATWRPAALIGLTVILTLMRTGAYWDVQWHATVGRDSFWIPPHDLIYSGVAVAGLLGLIITWRDGLLRRPGIGGWPWGWTIAMFGAGAMLMAAPFDDLWHRLYGIDITIWSPPHMVGVLGGNLIGWGALISWLLALRAASTTRGIRWALVGALWSAIIVVSLTNFGLVPAVRWSVAQPMVRTLYPALGSLFVPLAMIVVMLATGRWWTPLAIAGGLVLLRLLDQPLYALSTEFVVPLYRQTPRSNGASLYRILWFIPLLTALPALALSVAGRHLGRSWPGALQGLAVGGLAGAALWLGALILSLGFIIPTFPVQPSSWTNRDFKAETALFAQLLGTSAGAALGWAILFGALGGLVALAIVWQLGRIERAWGRPATPHGARGS